jgi:hypothetical protein
LSNERPALFEMNDTSSGPAREAHRAAFRTVRRRDDQQPGLVPVPGLLDVTAGELLVQPVLGLFRPWAVPVALPPVVFPVAPVPMPFVPDVPTLGAPMPVPAVPPVPVPADAPPAAPPPAPPAPPPPPPPPAANAQEVDSASAVASMIVVIFISPLLVFRIEDKGLGSTPFPCDKSN